MTKKQPIIPNEVLATINLDLVNVRNKELEVIADLKLKISIADGSIESTNVEGAPYSERTYPCKTNHYGMMPIPAIPIDKINTKQSLDNNRYVWGVRSR